MQYPTDAFSLSWHSGCENSELPMPWNPLSRHCSTDKSSSIGSMESLDQPAHNYYEGTLSPIDPSMYQNKRDSAYSSFSASSNTSDYTLSARTEESPQTDCVLDSSKLGDGRYLHTGQGAIETQEETSPQSPAELQQRPSSFPFDTNHLSFVKSPPQPPIRRDSLRASKNKLCRGERRRASAPGDALQMSGMWSLEGPQHKNSENVQCQCGARLCTAHLKDGLSSDQYYMLSSQTDKFAVGKKEISSYCTEKHSRRQGNVKNLKGTNNIELENASCYSTNTIKNTFSKQLSCPYTNSSSLNSCDKIEPGGKTVLNKDDWTQSQPFKHLQFQMDKCNGISKKEDKCNNPRVVKISEGSTLPETADFTQHSGTNKEHPVVHSNSSERSDSEPNDANHDAFQVSLPKDYVGSMRSSSSTETLIEESREQEENKGPMKKMGSSRHRSAQMRKRSDRFATNLRNEIQRRKAQLQKSKGSSVLLCGEETVEEREEPIDCPPPSRPAPPPPPPKNKLRMLEIKRVNAEQFQKNTECPTLEQKEQSHPLKEDSEKDNHGSDAGENILNTMESITKKDEKSLAFKSKLQNDFNKSSVHDSRQRDNRRYPEHTSSDEDSPPRYSVMPTTKSFRDEFRSVTPEFQRQNSRCLDKRDSDTGSIGECTTTGVQWNKGSSVPLISEIKVSQEMRRTSSSLSINSVGSQTENPRGNNVEDNMHYKGQKPLVTNAKFSGLMCGKEQIYSDGISSNDWRIISNENIDQLQRRQEVILQEAVSLNDHPSVIATQRPFFHPSPDFEDCNHQQMPSGGRWKWSPEHKLQPHLHLPQGSSPDASAMHTENVISANRPVAEDNILMPFADRRRFFENTSKIHSVPHISVQMKQNKNSFCPSFPDPPLSQKVVSDLRRRSVDHTFHPSSPNRQDSASSYSECFVNHAMDPLLCCNQSSHASEYLHHHKGHGCRVHDGYVCCSSDLCPTMLKRNMPLSHVSCHCLHHHHHHQWTRYGDYLCPAQHNTLEDGASLHRDPWHVQKSVLQEVPLNEWTQLQKVPNRKCSQTGSDLCHNNSVFHRTGPCRTCCDNSDQDFPPCYRTVSSYDLSCDHPRQMDLPSFQSECSDPSMGRGRAYSVSQLNLDCLALRERRECPLFKLEEHLPNAPAKKEKPPRPPPPNWDKFKERRASHESSHSTVTYSRENSASPVHSLGMETARQRSQSLPMERMFLKVTKNNPSSELEPSQSRDNSPRPPDLRPAQHDMVSEGVLSNCEPTG
ncbi:hypothetical protein GDO86_015240 [Hymenochirus boettgeri]|nr:hypothetical protein GDO86_015240 [Hymenochirus boettgeri]